MNTNSLDKQSQVISNTSKKGHHTRHETPLPGKDYKQNEPDIFGSIIQQTNTSYIKSSTNK
ncbi:hypothetical protein ENUP19_0042G0057 [Entamoeba nuttalli]|uniref:Uncharacterized protein n=1 Tax=Entamoeba nuttalli TaxID=412467 RepID=A0ABQ0DAC0_9EUKA